MFTGQSSIMPKAAAQGMQEVVPSGRKSVDKAELTECAGTLSGTAAAAVRDGLHLLFDWL